MAYLGELHAIRQPAMFASNTLVILVMSHLLFALSGLQSCLALLEKNMKDLAPVYCLGTGYSRQRDLHRDSPSQVG